MEKVQAGLRRSQLKMQICGAWVFWSRRPKEEAQPEGRKRVRPGGGGSTKGSQKGEGVKSCRQGAPLVPKALSLFRQPEGAPRVLKKGVGEVRWPVLAGAAPPAPGSASVPSFCGETEPSQRRLMDQKRCQGREFLKAAGKAHVTTRMSHRQGESAQRVRNAQCLSVPTEKKHSSF